MTSPGAITRTTCAYCGVGCGVIAERTAGGTQVRGDPAHPAGAGRLCSKGSALADTLGNDGRLLRPRIGGRETGWDEALDAVASRFAATIAEHGPDAVAFYVSGQLLTEDYYVANKLMKGFIGSANIDTNSRLCMSSAVVAHQRAFGEDVVPGCYEDLDLADLVVLVGSNTAWCHPVLFRRIEEARPTRPAMRIVVIDPRRTPTCEQADLHLPLRAGSDVHLFNGLLAWLDREGITDAAFTAAHTTGASEAVAVARAGSGSVTDVAAACGLEAGDVETFYRMFAATERVVTAFSQGVNQSSSGSDKASSILNCHLLTGRIGKPGMGPFSLTGQPNAMGGREVGGMASTLAAHMNLEDAGHRRIAQDFWRSPRMASRPGLKAIEMFDAVRAGRIKALWIMATNPAVSLPDADRVRDAIAGCDFVVVSDCVAETDTTAVAHVLLPAAAWGERNGTTTNSERCISRQRSFQPSPGDARPDWWIVGQVAARMGFAEAFAYAAPHEIFDEHARLSAAASAGTSASDGKRANAGTRKFDIGGLAGLSAEAYDALEPIQWPVPEAGHPGTPRLFADGRFTHADGRARLVPVTPRAPHHATGAQFPFVLNTGRIRDQWHTMTRTGASARLAEHLPEPFADMHTGDAAAAGIVDGDLATVSTCWGRSVVRARIGDGTPRGMLFVPMHWSATNSSAGRAGALVNPVVDPASGEPEFKHTPAALQRFDARWHGVLFARHARAAPTAEWWTRVQGDGFVRYELAGTDAPADLAAWGRSLLADNGVDADELDYLDDGAGVYRAARICKGKLHACVFLSPLPALPARSWLGGLFAKAALDETDRLALLAGRPLGGVTDPSPVVCSCFGVRKFAIGNAIVREGLQTAAQVGACLKAGTSCGSCVPEIRGMLAALTAGVALARPPRAT